MDRRQCFKIAAADAARKLPGPAGELFTVALHRGSLLVELYQPRDHDPQQPHTRDEAYVVLEGAGSFFMGDEQVRFGPGDFLFVPAGVPHRFADFGHTLTAWVIFFGPEGGEPI
jgi:mannose-6-phosphate isomerase-like protein (cupin superfamily)